jgi:transcription antitermination factor NusG
MDSHRWYVLYLRSRYEKRVHEELQRRGIESFLPTIMEVRQWSDRKKKVEMPLFPGYDFVRIDLKERVRVLEVDGVVKFVSIGDSRPVPVPDKQIESL